MTNEPMNGCFYLVSGGPAQYRDGKWYSGVEAPFYQCELQWTPTWWYLFPDTDPTAQDERIEKLEAVLKEARSELDDQATRNHAAGLRKQAQFCMAVVYEINDTLKEADNGK